MHEQTWIRGALAVALCFSASVASAQTLAPGSPREARDESPMLPDSMETARGLAMGLGARASAMSTNGVAYNPAGGTHHGRPDRASGFCFFNDPVLGILALLDGGLERVFYADLDAHHGDGVQDAFADDPRVLTVSIHEARRWPHTGVAGDRGGVLR